MSAFYRLIERHPDYRSRLVALEGVVARRMRAARPRRVGPVTIPVVVHVVYRTAAENVSVAQIRSQIRVLNRDYHAQNPDRKKVPAVWKGIVADPGVQFALAKKDPQGKATTGITRRKTQATSFTDDDAVKSAATGGTNAWPRARYLNLWVCTLSDDILGYAQFPGGPARTDGVVILNTAFGTTGSVQRPFHLGRTATHEVGHWLNLHHIWGDGLRSCQDSDFVDDTPNQEGPNIGKPSFPNISCNNGPNGDMFMNYMDYVDDAAMFMFSQQQVVRMQATLDGPRRRIGR
jgi:hypothetical protein